MTCNPLRLMFGSVLRDSALSANDAIDGNLYDLHNEHRSRFVQFDRDDTAVIESTLLTDAPIDTVAIAQHNLSANAVIRVELIGFDGAVISSRLFDQNSQLETHTLADFVGGLIPFCGEPIHPWPDPLVAWFDAPEKPAKIRITISDPQNKDLHTRVKIGLVMAGEYVKLSRNMGYGHQIQHLTTGALTELKSGYSMRSKLRRSAKSWSLSLDDMPPDDQQRLHDADEAAGNQPALISGYPDSPREWLERQYNFIGLVGSAVSYTHSHHRAYSVPLNFKEV